MTQSKRSKPTKQPKRRVPGFWLARIVLYSVGAASAAFGALGWIIPDLPSITWAGGLLAGLTALSAAVVPVSCEILGRSWWSILLAPAALVFGGINAYSFHHAVDSLIEQPRIEAHAEHVIDPLKVALTTAAAAVSNHAVPSFPDTMGPLNIKGRMDAWTAVHDPLVAAEAAAQARLDTAPALEAMVASWIVWLIATAIDLSLAAGLAGIGLVRASAQRQIDAELVAELLAKRAAKRDRDQAAAAEAARKEKAARRTKRGVPTTSAPPPASPAPVAAMPRLRVVR